MKVGNLIFDIYRSQRIKLGDDIELTVYKASNGHQRMRIAAPLDVRITKEYLDERETAGELSGQAGQEKE